MTYDSPSCYDQGKSSVAIMSTDDQNDNGRR